MLPIATIARLAIMLRMDHVSQLVSAIALYILEERNKLLDARYASLDILSCIATVFNVLDVNYAPCSSCVNLSALLMLLLSTLPALFQLRFRGLKHWLWQSLFWLFF